MAITKQTALDIAMAHREIEAAETLLDDLAKTMRETSVPDVRDIYGRKRDGLRLGVPNGDNAHTLFNVPQSLAKPVIDAHIAAQRAKLVDLDQAAAVELGVASPMLPKAAADVIAERRRRVDAEGYRADHDDAHIDRSLAKAAACYASFSALAERDRALELYGPGSVFTAWPWDPMHWKPTTRRADLVKAAALILAEIERLDRAEARP